MITVTIIIAANNTCVFFFKLRLVLGCEQVLAVTESSSASAFFSSELSQQLMTEGNAVADRLQAHYTTTIAAPHQKCNLIILCDICNSCMLNRHCCIASVDSNSCHNSMNNAHLHSTILLMVYNTMAIVSLLFI